MRLLIEQVSNIRLWPSLQEVHRGGKGSKPSVAPDHMGASMNDDNSEEVSAKLLEPIKTTTSQRIKRKAAELTENAASVAGRAVTLVGDLNGDGKVDEEDARIARDHAAQALSVATNEAGRLAKSVARAPLTKDVATYAAAGAVIAIPLPFIGSAIGAAVGAGLGLWRNMTRHETLAVSSPDAFASSTDPLAELERLHGLKEKGVITDDEFLSQKRKLLK